MSNSARERVLRFDLAVQANRFFAYGAAFATAMVGNALGVFHLNLLVAIVVLTIASLAAGICWLLLRAGADRRWLNPAWISVDVAIATFGIWATGGIPSPWFIWYLAPASAAAFVIGRRAAYVFSLLNTVAYLGVLMWMGQATLFNDVFLLALCRMVFLVGASYFFLTGVSNLAAKRQEVRSLEEENSRKIAELTRLTNELAEANRRIQEADRLKSQFLATMSHELRTPMNSIIGFSEILAERLDGKIDPKHVTFLRHILASGQHLLGIINDILDLSKIEAGKMEVYPEEFRVATAVESVCHVMRGMTAAQANFITDIPDDLPMIETDLAKFKQVLFNLLSNAIKFSPPEKAVTISARNVYDTITVSVRDEGIGVDPQYHEVIFQEFRQIDGTARREFGGTGLGLAIVKKFVELQGGRVSIESTPGGGSTFSFTLPLRSRAAVVTRAPDLQPLVQSIAERVLVVEDDPSAFELISSALRSAGYLAVRARHGDEALRLAREVRPVAITLDLIIPGVDGWEVLKRMKSDEVTRDIPVVIISVIDNRELGVALGADDYFIKPVDRDRLIDRLRKLTENRLSRARLLLIDDDESVHILLEEELTTLGYTLESAFNGESGIRAARERSPDVIILDLMMPGMSGFDVAESLKESPATANIPILVLTSKDVSSDDRRELQTKVTSFVRKGKSARDQLVREIRRLEQRRVGAATQPP